MLFKKDSIKEYTNDDELISFYKQTWGDYIQSIDDSVIAKLLSIQSHGLKNGDTYDDNVIGVYRTELWKFPPVPFDIIVYRGGEIHIPGRPFLSASFYKKTAEYFADNKKHKLHTIIIRKGACIVPSLYLCNTLSFSEKEVITDVSCLHKRIGYYEYFRKIER
ncbi:MAG: hypothetical protein NC177_15180 [Ruminococcus flavefaciens]|nr:hypothetical protein [Ruminococcus flavefaciens]